MSLVSRISKTLFKIKRSRSTNKKNKGKTMNNKEAIKSLNLLKSILYYLDERFNSKTINKWRDALDLAVKSLGEA